MMSLNREARDVSASADVSDAKALSKLLPSVSTGGRADMTRRGRETAPTVVASESEAANDAVGSEELSPGTNGETLECDQMGRPIVYVEPGQLQRAVRTAEWCLAQTGRHFHRGGEIVTVLSDPARGESLIQALHQLALIHALDGVSSWRRFNAAKNVWIQTDPPGRICNVMLKMGRFDYLPALSGLARQPFLRPDGSACLEAAHDQATGLYGVFNPADFDVPVEPTRDQAQQALMLLDDLLEEFAFAASSDRSAALAALITAAVRPSLPLAPMFHVRAPQISSGKSYLCELITVLATPQRGAPVGFPGGDEECTKLLLAQLVRSPAVIEFDNLTGDLKPHKSLCTALTSERMEGRVLGRSKVMAVGTRALFLSSGNNVGPVADMTRRCITIHLDPGCEVPAARAFRRPDLIADVRRDRGRYVSAALTVVRAWIVAGRPLAACPPLASFADWSNWCRQPLLWLGRPDPAAAVFAGMADDPERQLLGRLLVEWHQQFGERDVMVRDVIGHVSVGRFNVEELAEILQEIAGDRGKINSRKLGKWITRHAGRIVDGLKLVRAPKTRNAENWRVESVRSVESVSSVHTAIAEDPGL